MLKRSFLYVDAIARTGSVRKAAERLHVAASAVNRQLLDLEEELGVALFERVASGMRATAAGELVLAHIRRQKRDFALTHARLEELRGLRRGTVRIAAHQSASRDIVPHAMASLRARFPGVDYDVNITDFDGISAALVADTADLGVAFNPPPNARLRQVSEVTMPVCAIVPVRHPLAGRTSLRLSDCLGYPIASTQPRAWPGAGNGAQALVEMAATQAGLSFAPALQTGSFELMVRFVQEADGVFFQIAAAVAPELRRGELAAIPLLDPGLGRGRLALLARRGRALEVLPALFAETMAEEMRAPRLRA